MPHVGGGGHFGGGHSFHSSGFRGSGIHSSARRYDNHGHLHSHYYVRPGFYYRSRFVPYSREERESLINYIGAVFLFIIAFVLACVSFSIIGNKGEYSEDRLRRFALDQYEEVYDKSKFDYEKNILVTFVTYEDKSTYDYLCIIGDDVNSITWSCFYNNDADFCSALRSNLRKYNYSTSLYRAFSDSLDKANEYIGSFNLIYSDLGTHGSSTNSQIILDSKYKVSDSDKYLLMNKCDKFHSYHGYNISFVIVDNEKAYSIDWKAFIVIWSLTGLTIFGGILSLVETKKRISFIENAIKNGEAKDYYEGEDPFEEYSANNPYQ